MNAMPAVCLPCLKKLARFIHDFILLKIGFMKKNLHELIIPPTPFPSVIISLMDSKALNEAAASPDASLRDLTTFSTVSASFISE